jgi:hypothetical protein
MLPSPIKPTEQTGKQITAEAKPILTNQKSTGQEITLETNQPQKIYKKRGRKPEELKRVDEVVELDEQWRKSKLTSPFPEGPNCQGVQQG